MEVILSVTLCEIKNKLDHSWISTKDLYKGFLRDYYV